MKKIVTLLMCITIMVCLCACGSPVKTVVARRDYSDGFQNMTYTVLTYEYKGNKVKAVYHEDGFPTEYDANVYYRSVVSQISDWKEYDLRVDGMSVTYHEIDFEPYFGMSYDELITYITDAGYTITEEK